MSCGVYALHDHERAFIQVRAAREHAELRKGGDALSWSLVCISTALAPAAAAAGWDSAPVRQRGDEGQSTDPIGSIPTDGDAV